MSFRPAIILMLIFCAVLLSAVQTSPSGASQAANSQANLANAAESAQFKRFPAADEGRALQADIRKMRALVQQMETNLAYVDTTQTPLKHQFQLEIDMWKTVIDHMEKNLSANKAH